MNETTEGNRAAAGQQTHIIAAVFALPAMLSWFLGRIFVFPVLVGAWLKMSPPYTHWTWVMDAAHVLFSAVLVPVVLSPLILLLLDRYIGAWLRLRHRLIAVALWIVNAVVLAAVAFLCLGLAIIARMLIA